MIIQIGTEADESRILWKHKESDEWEKADIDDLIEAYENIQNETKPDDSISRQTLINEVLEDGNGAVLSYTKGMDEDELVERIEKQMIDHFIGIIKYAPPAKPKQPKGKWIDRNGWAYCSNCGKAAVPQNNGCEIEPCHTPFCPWCNSDMRGNEE